MKHKSLPDQVIVVFGASSGIGRATALAASTEGACVVAAARGREALETLEAEAGPGEVVVITAEAADPEQVKAVADLAISRFGRVSVTEIQPAAIATPFFEHSRTRLGVRPSGPPPVYSPEKVAKAILRSAVRPRHTVVVGGAGKAELVFQRVSPKAMDVFSRITAFRLQKSKDPKGPRDGDALDNPVEGDDRVHGVVTTTHR